MEESKNLRKGGKDLLSFEKIIFRYGQQVRDDYSCIIIIDTG